MLTAAEAWGVMGGLMTSREETTRTPDPTPMREVERILRFVLAGNARFTIVSQKTGTRFTFRVRSEKEEGPWFVSVLTGSNNDTDYQFLGTVFAPRNYRHGKKSKIAPDAPSAKAFAWFWAKLTAGELPESCEFFHSGRCGRCGRTLTVPTSVETGLGPECEKHAVA